MCILEFLCTHFRIARTGSTAHCRSGRRREQSHCVAITCRSSRFRRRAIDNALNLCNSLAAPLVPRRAEFDSVWTWFVLFSLQQIVEVFLWYFEHGFWAVVDSRGDFASLFKHDFRCFHIDQWPSGGIFWTWFCGILNTIFGASQSSNDRVVDILWRVVGTP